MATALGLPSPTGGIWRPSGPGRATRSTSSPSGWGRRSGTLITCCASARSNARMDVRMSSDASIAHLRDPISADEAVWRRLWAAYNEFYQVDVPEPVTASTWRRMLDAAVPVVGRLAEQNDVVCGF